MKFRAWVKAESRFLEWKDFFWECFHDNGLVVQMWTGCVDMDGREVYQGDIVRDDFEYEVKFGSYFSESWGSDVIGFYLESSHNNHVFPLGPNDFQYVKVVGHVNEIKTTAQ